MTFDWSAYVVIGQLNMIRAMDRLRADSIVQGRDLYS
jgi:hypothetical protein